MAPFSFSSACSFYDLSTLLVPAPVVSFSHAQNAVTTKGGVVTVTGVNFRTLDQTPTANIGSDLCSTAAWSSKSSLACILATVTDSGFAKDIVVTTSDVVGTRTARFSFDGAGLRFCFCKSYRRSPMFHTPKPLW